MSLIPFVVVAFGGAAVSLLTRRWPRASIGSGLAALAGTAVAAAVIRPGDVLEVGDGALVGSQYVSLFGVAGALAGIILCVVALATAWQRNLPGSVLAIVGASVVALAMPEPTVAVMSVLAGGLAGVLVTVVVPVTGRDVGIAVRELRALTIAGALGIVATAWIARPLGPIGAQPTLLGLAYLAFALAVAIRFGVIPFHTWAARLSDSAPEPALPFLMAWGPATLGLVALGWAATSVAPFAAPLGLERGLVLAVAAATLLLGAFAAWIQDDVEHVVGYSIVQDAGFVLLALASLDPAAGEPTRTWILAFVLSKSAFAGWAVAVRGAFGTRRLAELGGWARRSPLLGVALGVIAAASVGWPGLVVWEARGRILELAVDGPLRVIIAAGGIASLAYYGRLLAVGLRRPSETVAAGPNPWPERPPREVAERVAARRAAVVDALTAMEPLWSLNRAPIAAVLVLVLSLAGCAVAAGGFGIAEAARAPSAQSGVPQDGAGPSAEPSPGLEPSLDPSAEPSLEPSFEPLPSPS